MATVTMGSVWDRTTEVLSGRSGILASIAALTLWLPAVARQAIGLALTGMPPVTTPGITSVMGLLAIVTFVIALYGQLSVIAVASDPATTRADAFRLAGRRLAPAVGVMALILIAIAIVCIPFGIVLARSGVTPASLQAGAMPTLSPGANLFVALYSLVLLVGLVWLYARLMPLLAVVLHEQRGLGSFARAFALTRRLVWRLAGVLILFGIVAGVLTLATNSVAGTVLALALGRDSIAASLLLAAITQVVSAGLSVVASVFVARLYLARVVAPAAG